ncbi:4a-hydroxytetrahydrobiopterin dehydratase [Bacillus sp. HMF5848]|uniref:4a-hydroxytetrahydrobiopterin dehydratase n=1 Tax=Bacillus sp. HMF5848 TaxID=2495421 RepID=UPI000F7B07C8|nr:4a-hydroxytetrahydrobiopterin dehydratase [Bacillus sp. HMF5848]RSK27235.1 4a-hydroxytetrahydrobiopterin dehydratase [Bacillus sp. HMF5848]
MEPLRDEEIVKVIHTIENWHIVEDGNWIQRKYRFKDYLVALQFVHEIGTHAETIQHHPFISIDYKLVNVKLTSWRAKGVTKLDIDCAKHYNEIYNKLIK